MSLIIERKLPCAELFTSVCPVCGCKADKLCSKCRVVHYCSKSHQSSPVAWIPVTPSTPSPDILTDILPLQLQRIEDAILESLAKHESKEEARFRKFKELMNPDPDQSATSMLRQFLSPPPELHYSWISPLTPTVPPRQPLDLTRSAKHSLRTRLCPFSLGPGGYERALHGGRSWTIRSPCKSYYAVPVFDYTCYWASSFTESSPIPAYNRGDYAGLNLYFCAFQWSPITSLPLDDMEEAISTAVAKAASQFISTYIPGPRPTRKFPRHIRTPIRQKQSAYQRFKLTQYEDDLLALRKLQNEVNSSIRRHLTSAALELSKRVSGNPKLLFKTVRSKRSSAPSAAIMANGDGSFTSTPQESADILAQFYASVFNPTGSSSSSDSQKLAPTPLSSIPFLPAISALRIQDWNVFSTQVYEPLVAPYLGKSLLTIDYTSETHDCLLHIASPVPESVVANDQERFDGPPRPGSTIPSLERYLELSQRVPNSSATIEFICQGQRMDQNSQPNCEQIGRQFAEQYYQTLQAARQNIGSFYHEQARMSYEGTEFVGRDNIAIKLQSIKCTTLQVAITSVDTQAAESALLIFVCGQLKADDDRPLPFTEFFMLKLLNDCFLICNSMFRLNLHHF
ncbi:unnamed protein product [Calicophoron daubneyi]|uniref:NTF2 domain-containing protein n=1 Tax=Calicophoron daubneyi TaxID=300641 RepID=A0AAV2TMP9_CALDB